MHYIICSYTAETSLIHNVQNIRKMFLAISKIYTLSESFWSLSSLLLGLLTSACVTWTKQEGSIKNV